MLCAEKMKYLNNVYFHNEENLEKIVSEKHIRAESQQKTWAEADENFILLMPLGCEGPCYEDLVGKGR